MAGNDGLPVAGIVLCGGRSTRMGQPKAWLPIGGETMLTRVVSVLRSVVAPVVAVAAVGQPLPALPAGVEVVRDDQPGRGPLQGLAGGLAALAGRASAAYVSSCDVPFLRPAFVRRLIDLLGDHAICVPHVGGHHHPLAAVYRLEVLPVVRQLLDADRLRPFFLFEAAATRFVEAGELVDADPDLASLRNVNTPDEYAQAIRDAEAAGAG